MVIVVGDAGRVKFEDDVPKGKDGKDKNEVEL